MFDSQEPCQDRLQGLKRHDIGHSKFGAWSQGNATELWPALILLENTLTVQSIVCNIKTSFIFLLGKRIPNDPVSDRLVNRPPFCSFWKTNEPV